MRESVKNFIKWVFDLVLGYIGFTLLGEVQRLVQGQTLGIESLKGWLGISAIIGATALTVYLLLKWWKSRLSIKRIERVQAFIFFPKGTPEDNKNLNYHKKHYHKKLIVNYKRNPPQAYHLHASNTSYGWKLVQEYPDLWTSVDDSVYPDPDTQKWCKERSYKLNPWSASKEELLESDSSDVKSKEIDEQEQFLKEKTSFEQTKTELLKALYFFPEYWETYKKLIDDGKLESPQSGEIKWCSDQIKSAITGARLLNLNKINAIIPQIEAISNDMALFGVAVQRFSQSILVIYGEGDEEKNDIISRGDTLYEELQRVIRVVEQSFDKKKGKISKLIEVYSPIHAMIVRVNREIPRESVLQMTAGVPVKASLIDSNSISAVFNQHNDKLRKKDLNMWLEIEEEIKARNYFFLGRDRQKWFDELEAEYNRLTKHQQG